MPKNLKALLWRGRVIDLAAYALCATMLGHTAATAFDHAPPPAEPMVKARVAAVPRPRPVIERNIFCSTCRERSPASPSREPEPTALPLALVAILYAPPPRGATASLAVVRDTETHGFRLVAPGDHLRGATVVDVGETRLRLDHQGRSELLDLLQVPALAPAPIAATPLDRGIRQLADGSYEIERATLEALLADTPALLQAARVVPELRDGRAAGFRLHAVRPDGILARIGLRNGDVVVAVNGLPLTAPERALDAFVKLRSASHVSLSLERGGQRLTADYRIR
jgi:general secretion pathway protein C